VVVQNGDPCDDVSHCNYSRQVAIKNESNAKVISQRVQDVYSFLLCLWWLHFKVIFS